MACPHQSFRRPKPLPWQRDLLEDSLKAAGLPGLDNAAKLYVSNLDIGVTNEDIRVTQLSTIANLFLFLIFSLSLTIDLGPTTGTVF